MKNLLLLIITSLFISSNAFSQEGKHLVKYNVVHLIAYKDISFEYETALSKKSTIGSAISFRPPGKIPRIGGMKNTKTHQYTRYSHISIAPEYRGYLKKAHHGLYFALFIKYTHFMFNANIPRDDGSLLMNLKGSMGAISTGGAIGVSLYLGGNFYLDSRIYGLHAGFLLGSISKEQSLTIEEQEIIENSTESPSDFFLTMPGFKRTIDSNGIHLQSRYKYIGFRSSFSIVYRF